MERRICSFGSAFAIAVLLAALLFVIKTLTPSLEEWAEGAFGHAWLYMGVLALVVFAALGLTPIHLVSGSRGLTRLIIGATVVSGVAILAASAFVAATE